MALSIPDKPFVGMAGRENSLAVIQQVDRVVCHITSGRYWFGQVILALFAAALSSILWFSFNNRAARLPLFWALLVWCLTIVCWAVFIRNLFGTPRIELLYGISEIWLFRWRSEEPWQKISKDAISRFEIYQQLYTYRSRQVENFVLALVTRDSKRVPLCVSTKQELIRSLAEDFVKVTGRNLQML